MDKSNKYALIIGAGPAGLAAAYELIELNSNVKPIVIDKLPVAGGLSRTVYHNNSGIDIGGHRLFSNDKYVQSIWFKFLKPQSAPSIDDFYAHRDVHYSNKGLDPNFSDDVLLKRKRFSSIIKNNKRFRYPIRLNLELFINLGFVNSIKALFGYFKSFFFRKDEYNIENFLINRFGLFLYNMFFYEHSKKIWGIEPKDIFNEWDTKRIQKSLFSFKKLWEDEFFYPKFGCSQLWDKMAQYILDNGGTILFNTEFLNFVTNDNKIIKANVKNNEKNEIFEIPADYFISSIPIKELIKSLDVPYDVKQNALNLPYRDYILVSLYTKEFRLENTTKYSTVNNVVPDSWIYLQNENTISSRMQIMNNWSPYLVNNFKNNYIISLEYFCNENDDIWSLDDNDLVRLAIKESEEYGFLKNEDVFDSKVIREKCAYPVYSGSYKHIDKIKNFINNYKNIYMIGRNGEHKYINMDSAMVCGITIARDINKGLTNGK